jgi:hypothetical protein
MIFQKWIIPITIKNPYSFGRYVVATLLSLFITLDATQAQTTPLDTPLMVYGSRILKPEDLKRTYGDAAVHQVVHKVWAVQKRLQLTVLFDFFTYDENDQGELVKMTGFLIGPCDKVLESYFQAAMPLLIAERGRPLPARVSALSIKIEPPDDPSLPLPYFGGQTVELSFDKDRTAQSCTLTHTFRRKTS